MGSVNLQVIGRAIAMANCALPHGREGTMLQSSMAHPRTHHLSHLEHYQLQHSNSLQHAERKLVRNSRHFRCRRIGFNFLRRCFFLICRRARRQRSQSPILVTVRIDKHFKLYIDWSLSGKSKNSQLASHVMESTSRFLLIAQSAIRKAATLQSSYSRTATTHNCKNMQMKSQH